MTTGGVRWKEMTVLFRRRRVRWRPTTRTTRRRRELGWSRNDAERPEADVRLAEAELRADAALLALAADDARLEPEHAAAAEEVVEAVEGARLEGLPRPQRRRDALDARDAVDLDARRVDDLRLLDDVLVGHHLRLLDDGTLDHGALNHLRLHDDRLPLDDCALHGLPAIGRRALHDCALHGLPAISRRACE